MFIIEGAKVKNEQERLVVLNCVARSVVDSVRGWKSARVCSADQWKERTGNEAADDLRRVRVHERKHTFGRRLRAAGVSFEDRQDLLGHKSSRITTHYSSAELTSLIAAAEKVCNSESHNSPATT